ncbi:hypothetical protein ACLEPN_05505 [Myxococcus sp. 1LA]
MASGSLSPAGTVAAGLALVNTMGAVAGVVGCQGAADVAGSGIGGLAVGGGVIIGKGAQAVASALGASQGVASTTGLLTGAGVVLGAPGVLAVGTAKAVGEGAQWVVGKLFGQSAAKSVSNVTREFDPFLSGSIANKPFKAAAKGVKAVGNFFGKLF